MTIAIAEELQLWRRFHLPSDLLRQQTNGQLVGEMKLVRDSLTEATLEVSTAVQANSFGKLELETGFPQRKAKPQLCFRT